MGIENELSKKTIGEADAVLFAVDIDVEKRERFEGRKTCSRLMADIGISARARALLGSDAAMVTGDVFCLRNARASPRRCRRRRGRRRLRRSSSSRARFDPHRALGLDLDRVPERLGGLLELLRGHVRVRDAGRARGDGDDLHAATSAAALRENPFIAFAANAVTTVSARIATSTSSVIDDRQDDRPAVRSVVPHSAEHRDHRSGHRSDHDARDHAQRIGCCEGIAPSVMPIMPMVQGSAASLSVFLAPELAVQKRREPHSERRRCRSQRRTRP